MQPIQLTLNFDVQINVQNNIPECGQNQSQPETKNKITEVTPFMAQWLMLKDSYPDVILLFRVGDFYEAYKEDAIEICKVINITLTHRNSKTKEEMCGFPFHALDRYLPMIVRAGKRVAICDQIDETKRNTKKLVKRPIAEFDKFN